jgi:hypothetical protein
MTDDGLRASHDDRERVVEVLRVAAGDGRLTADELDQRIELALTARTYGELSALVADLPAQSAAAAASASGAAAAAAKRKDVLRIDRFGANARQAGRWTVPKRVEVDVTGGNVTLDFTEAIITLPSLQVSAKVMGGNLTLITKPGIVVDSDEMAFVGGNVKTREHPDDRGPVLLRVEISGRITGGNLLVRPPRAPRRTFWQWLRRAPARPAITARLSPSHHWYAARTARVRRSQAAGDTRRTGPVPRWAVSRMTIAPGTWPASTHSAPPLPL